MPRVELEHKTFPLGQLKAADAGNGSISGYASVFGNVDLQNDRVLPGAFKDGLDAFLKDGFISWGHDWGLPCATLSSVREDDHGLYVEAEYHSTPIAQEKRTITAERIARGKSMGLSIGYSVNPGGVDWDAKGVRNLKSLTVYEAALTPVPANQLAGVTAAKHAKGGAMERWQYITTKDAYDALSGADKLALYYDLETAGLLGSADLKAAWTASYINDLEDDCFAAIEGGGTKDDDGKTTPRSLRHYPHHPKGNGASGTGGTVDEVHLKNALARVANPDNYQGGKAHLDAHAKKLGIGEEGDKAARFVPVQTSADRKVMTGLSWANPFNAALPGSYEDLQEDLQEAAAGMLAAWAAGPLGSILAPDDIGYDTCLCLIATFADSATFWVCGDAWDDPDDGGYFRVGYMRDAAGAIAFGTPELLQPAFVPASAASEAELRSRRLSAAVLAVKTLAARERKEGRVISGSNRDRLQSAHDAMSEAMGHVDAVLAASDPGEKQTDPESLKVWLASMRAQARALGVAV